MMTILRFKGDVMEHAMKVYVMVQIIIQLAVHFSLLVVWGLSKVI